MSKKKGSKFNIPKGVRAEFDDVDYWHKLPKNRFVELADGTKISEYEYMKRFMHEFYGKGFDREDDTKNILQTDEQKKEARRNNNNTNRDALLVSKKMGALNTIFQIEKGAYSDTSDAWEKTFKNESYNAAIKELLTTSCDELDIEYNTRTATLLLRTYFRIKKFLKMLRKDMKTREEMGEE